VSITDSTTPQPPSPPRSPRHFGRKILGLALAGLAIIAAFAIGAGISAGKAATPAPAPSSAPCLGCPSASPPAAPAPATPPPASDAMDLPLGLPAGITQGGTDAATVNVKSAEVFTTPADQYGEAPQNGYYIKARVSARALASFTGGFDVTSSDFYVKAGGEHVQEGDGNAYYALPDSQSELGYVTLAAGEHTSGWLVFDSPAPHGTIVYAPNLDGQPVASWKF
jgi:hypothetical protein